MKKSILLSSMVLLGCAGGVQAHPLDSPDIVYIDGSPCNAACQSYMAWSRHQTSSMAGQAARRSSGTAVQRATWLPRQSSKPATRVATLQPPSGSAAASGPVRPDVAASPAANGAAAMSSTRTVQSRVAAAVELAEQVTAATAEPTSGSDHLVALIMARPAIKSLSDLASRTVAIEARQSASGAAVRTAIAAAGATEVELRAGSGKAVDQLINGEASAAVLALACPEAAELFPDIPGFRIFRVALSPGSLKAQLAPR